MCQGGGSSASTASPVSPASAASTAKADASAHDKLVAALEAACVGPHDPASMVTSSHPSWSETQTGKQRWQYIRKILSNLPRFALIRSLAVAGLGAWLLFAAIPLWFKQFLSGNTASIVALAGCFCLGVAWIGVPGQYETGCETKAGFYGDESGKKHGVRNAGVRKAIAEVMSTFPKTWYIPSCGLFGGEVATVLQFMWRSRRGSSLPYKRIWVASSEDEEKVAADWVFPDGGYDSSKPVVLILPGLAPPKHWTESSEFVADLAYHLTKKCGMTVLIMVPRGSMDTQLKNPAHIFIASRVTDTRQVVLMANEAISQATGGKAEPVFGVGFSMGAMGLSNYCGRYGGDERLAGATSFCGMYDCALNIGYKYSKVSWQSILSYRMKTTMLTGAAIEESKRRGIDVDRIGSTEVMDMLTFDDQWTSPYTGFSGIEAYLREISLYDDDRWKSVSVPLLGVAAMDDPITHVDGMCAKELSTGNENLLFLITKSGGHVGWPVTSRPWERGYDFMNFIVQGFIESVMNKKYGPAA